MRRYTLFAALAAMAGMPLRVPAQSLSLGLIGGGSLTDAVQTETLYNIRTWSPSEDWIAGATFELHFRSRFSVEVDGMYRELHATRVGQTIVFCRLSGVAARREPDRPRKTMVCPGLSHIPVAWLFPQFGRPVFPQHGIYGGIAGRDSGRRAAA